MKLVLILLLLITTAARAQENDSSINSIGETFENRMVYGIANCETYEEDLRGAPVVANENDPVVGYRVEPKLEAINRRRDCSCSSLQMRRIAQRNVEILGIEFCRKKNRSFKKVTKASRLQYSCTRTLDDETGLRSITVYAAGDIFCKNK